MRTIRLFLLATLLSLTPPGLSQTFAQHDWKTDAIRYTDTELAKPGGGYGWEDQPDGHLAPAFAVTGILHHLDELPADRKPLADFIRTHHPQRGANKEAGQSGAEVRSLVYQQIRALVWLGEDVSGFKAEVRGWESQAGNIAHYEKQGYPVFMQEMMTPVCRHLLGLPQPEGMRSYLNSRRRNNGSFNNAPSAEGGDGNILNTYWGVYAFTLLNKEDPLRKETAGWVRSCQTGSGGFTHQPRPRIGAGDEVSYTWAAVKTLELLDAKPEDTQACIRYLLSLRNPDGGFGNRPGLPSTPMATFYAIEALKVLDARASPDTAGTAGNPAPAREDTVDFSGYKVFTAQFQAPGAGSPSEAVLLADSLGIHLWGAKNADPEWIAAAQGIAGRKKVPVTFFHANEEYGKYVRIPGMGSFSHILDPVFPAGAGFSHAGDHMSWPQFREGYLQPLLKADGALMLQISNNEPLTRLLLDESVRSRGYAGISTIHFSQNFLFFLPWLYQYRYQLPFIALQDAHGSECWWWVNELAAYRTLFLAREPTYPELVKALENNWVAAVRHDELSEHRTRMLGGAEGVQEYIRSHREDWKWWNEETRELNQPWAAVTVITPSDTLETMRPEKGICIRVRCWWDSNRHILKRPLVKPEQLNIDGVTVKPEYMEKKGRKGTITDSYYLYSFPDLPGGEHVISLKLRHLEDHTVRTLTKRFYF